LAPAAGGAAALATRSEEGETASVNSQSRSDSSYGSEQLRRKLGGKHGKRESKKAAVVAVGSGPSRPLAGTGLEDEMIFDYDVTEYDFRTCVKEMLEIDRCSPRRCARRGVCVWQTDDVVPNWHDSSQQRRGAASAASVRRGRLLHRGSQGDAVLREKGRPGVSQTTTNRPPCLACSALAHCLLQGACARVCACV